MGNGSLEYILSRRLAWYIVKCHHDPSTWRGLDKSAEHPEVAEVRDALWKHQRMLYGAYDYYSALHRA